MNLKFKKIRKFIVSQFYIQKSLIYPRMHFLYKDIKNSQYEISQ